METTLNSKVCFHPEYPTISREPIFDLAVLTTQIKKTKDWANGELTSMILFNSPEKQILLTAIHEGSEISSYLSKDSVTIQTIEGKLIFKAKNKWLTLDSGESLTIIEKGNYKLKCREKTVFLFTIS